MKIQTKAVHAGDRKKPGSAVPTSTPISTATAFTYDKMEELDRIFGRETPGYSYSRYDSPTSAALEELTQNRMESERFLCELRTISEIIAEEKIETIDLLKVDVEKSEWDVLQGISAKSSSME